MAGVPEDYKEIRTLRDLLEINYKHVPVEEQIRTNLITKMKNDEYPYKGIIGYDEDVIPAVNRAILSGHDILLIGQIGQAKTKIAESIAKNLLSLIPVVRGSITNDVPVSIPEEQLIYLLTGSDPVVFKPDAKIIATANPIDYTHSGKVIEPLFDRLRSHINTHYPTNITDEMLIIVQEARIANKKNVFLPIFILKTIAEITQLAR